MAALDDDIQAQVRVGFQDSRVVRERCQTADAVIETAAVIVVQDPAVGIGHAHQPAVVDATRHLCVAVAHAGRRRQVHRAATCLVFAGQLAETVEQA